MHWSRSRWTRSPPATHATNAALTGLTDQVEVRHGRIDTALAAGEQFPIILADPPYLPSADIARWPDDPASAIDGGVDGLDLVRVCLQVAGEHLAPEGALLLQVAGETQAVGVIAHLARTADLGLTHRETRHHDRDRAVMLLTGCGQKPDPLNTALGIG